MSPRNISAIEKKSLKSRSPLFDIGIGEIVSPEYSLEQIFAYLEGADNPCIVAIDEFNKLQDIQSKIHGKALPGAD